jgi:SM-20-related protein
MEPITSLNFSMLEDQHWEPRFFHLAAELRENGYCIFPDFFPETITQALSSQLLKVWKNGEFIPARVGAGEFKTFKPELRSDLILWLDNQSLTDAENDFYRIMNALRLILNQHLFLGLQEFTSHLAVYPPGAFYKRHIDQLKGMENRIVSCVTYLNHQWSQTDGGRLNLFIPGASGETIVEVEPRAGTFVVFMSNEIEHEVEPSQFNRLSLTGWMVRNG